MGAAGGFAIGVMRHPFAGPFPNGNADMAVDVTQSISISNGKIIIPGQLIHEVGTSVQPTSDTSEPGVVIQLLS